MNYQARLRVEVTRQDHAQGSPNASITLLEYGDFECPYCAQAFPIVEQLRRKLKNELRLVFRHFPLSEIHPHALDAARAAEAAARQDRFWEMHALLFKNRKNLDETSLYDYAATLGLDMFRFAETMGSPETELKILQDMEGGVRSGVNGTPTFFVNGVRFDGDWTGEGFLEELMAAAATHHGTPATESAPGA